MPLVPLAHLSRATSRTSCLGTPLQAPSAPQVSVSKGAQLRRQTEQQIAGTKHRKQCAKTYNDFHRYCLQHHLPAQPPTYDSVADFLSEFVVKNKGSAKSIGNMASQLRTEHRDIRRVPFLLEWEETLLAKLILRLHQNDKGSPNQKHPFRWEKLTQALARFNLDDLVQLQEATTLALAHNALFRTAETTSRILAADVIWERGLGAVTINIVDLTKTAKTGAKVPVRVCRSTHPHCGVALLERLWRRRRLSDHPEQYIFCSTAYGTLHPHQPISGELMRARIKRAAFSVGLDPALYSGHSLRAGAATDLFSHRIPYYVIKKMGRWVSDAALLYFRSEAAVARISATAFNWRARPSL